MRGSVDLGLVFLVAMTLPATGCGHEFVRVSLTPDAEGLVASPEPLPAPPHCVAVWFEGRGSKPRPDPPLSKIVARLLGGVATAPPSVGETAVIEARLRSTRVSTPVLKTVGGEFLVGFSFLLPPLFPVTCLYLEHEPEVVWDYELTVGVPGEPPAGRYATRGRGTIAAQAWGAQYESRSIRDSCRGDLDERAIRSLTTRFLADGAARARLAADLDPGPRPLEALLVTRETHPPRAHWRTRQLLAWKNERLAGHLAEQGAADLRSLVTRLEAAAVDLAREAELAKDAATRAAAAGAGARERELSLAYQERVEVLRPILALVKEELDARSR